MPTTAFAPSFSAASRHFVERGAPRVAEHVLVRARAPADDVAHRGEQVAEDVRADDRLAVHDAEVARDAPAFERSASS